MASLQGLHKTVEVEVGKHRVARKRTNQLGKFHSHFVLKLGIFASSKVIVDDHIAVESTLREIKQTIDDLIGRHVMTGGEGSMEKAMLLAIIKKSKLGPQPPDVYPLFDLIDTMMMTT